MKVALPEVRLRAKLLGDMQALCFTSLQTSCSDWLQVVMSHSSKWISTCCLWQMAQPNPKSSNLVDRATLHLLIKNFR
jgi:hypothetical protein